MPLVSGFGMVIKNPSLWKTWWGVAGASLIFIIWITHTYFNKKNIVFFKLFVPILLFFSWSVVSLIWSTNQSLAVFTVVKFFSYLLVFILSINLITNLKSMHWLVTGLAFLSLIASLVGLIEYYLPTGYMLISDLYFQTGELGTFFGNRNRSVQFVVLTLPFVIFLFLNDKSKVSNVVVSFFLFVIFLYLINATARQGYVAVIVELLLLVLFFVFDFFKNKEQALLYTIVHRKFKAVILAIIAILIIISSSFNIDSKPQNKLEHFASISEGVTNSRVPVWINTLEIIKDHPIIGVGAGQWKEHYPLYYNRAVFDKNNGEKVKFSNAHNDYIQMFSEYGIIGVLFLLWLAYLSTKTILKLILNINNKNRLLAVVIGCCFSGFAVVAFVSFPIGWYLPGLLLVLYLGMLSVLYFSNNHKFHLTINNKFIFIGVLMSFFASLFSFNYVYNSFKSESYFKESVVSFKLGDIKQSIIDIRSSLDFNKTAKSYAKIGEYLLIDGQPEEAIKYSLEAKDRSVFNVPVLLNLAEGYRVTNAHADEQRTLKAILNGDDKNVVAAARLVRSLVAINKYNEADPYYRQLKRNFEYFKNVKTYGPYHSEVSKTALLVEDYKYFAYIYNDLLQTDKTAENYAVYGVVEYQRVGNKSKAKKLLNQALKIDPAVNIPQVIKDDLGL